MEGKGIFRGALYYTRTQRDGVKTSEDYQVRLETTKPHFGGVRWWFLCPLSGRRAQVLYLPWNGGTVFASRQAWGMAYQSQRQTAEDRAVEWSFKARKRLGIADQNMLEMPYSPKPKWMRLHTHRRLVGTIRQCWRMQMAYMARRWPGMRL